jgi:hypothetical protein
MWARWIRDLRVELYWMEREISRRWRLDNYKGVVGILTLISGVLLLIVIAGGVAHAFRVFIPFLPGSRVEEIYWHSIGFGLKTSFLFLIFSGSLIIFFLLKFFDRR